MRLVHFYCCMYIVPTNGVCWTSFGFGHDSLICTKVAYSFMVCMYLMQQLVTDVSGSVLLLCISLLMVLISVLVSLWMSFDVFCTSVKFLVVNVSAYWFNYLLIFSRLGCSLVYKSLLMLLISVLVSLCMSFCVLYWVRYPVVHVLAYWFNCILIFSRLCCLPWCARVWWWC